MIVLVKVEMKTYTSSVGTDIILQIWPVSCGDNPHNPYCIRAATGTKMPVKYMFTIFILEFTYHLLPPFKHGIRFEANIDNEGNLPKKACFQPEKSHTPLNSSVVLSNALHFYLENKCRSSLDRFFFFGWRQKFYIFQWH